MTEEELLKYEQGRKLMDRIHKIDKQLEQLDKCDKVKVYSNNPNQDRIDFDFHKGNPYYNEALLFIDKFKTWLRIEKDELQKQFSKL